jgi:lysozyme family protein
MMINFDEAVNKVIENEGGIDSFVDDPADSGGATRCGLSLRFLRSIPVQRLKKYGIFEEPTPAILQNLTSGQIRLIYHHEFWECAPFEQIGAQRVCNYVFDCCVQHGLAQGIKLLQRATWAVTQIYGYVPDDGILGVRTINQVMILLSHHAFYEKLLTALCAERAGYCRLVVEMRVKDNLFLHGWLERAYRI